MAEKPITFNIEMVQAIFDGRKTQDRRPIMQAMDFGEVAGQVHPARESGYIAWFPGTGSDLAEFTKRQYDRGFEPPYAVGDVLWVRETWQLLDHWREYGQWLCDAWSGPIMKSCPAPFKPEYRADNNDYWDGPWLPSTHMPRWAARLFLTVTNVRAQRLQEINQERHDEVLREGWPFRHAQPSNDVISDFAHRWNSIYAHWKPIRKNKLIIRYECYPWCEEDIPPKPDTDVPCFAYPNPWVFAHEFERTEVAQ